MSEPTSGQRGGDEPDFETAIVRYLEGILDPDALARFNSELRTDSAKQERFVEFCLTRAGMIEQLKEEAEYARNLRERCEQDLDVGSAADTTVGADLSETMVAPALVESPDDRFDSIEMIFPPVVNIEAKRKFHRWWTAAAILVVLVGIGIAIGAILRAPSSQTRRTPVAAKASDSAPAALPESDVHHVTDQTAAVPAAGFGRLEQGVDAFWDPSTDPGLVAPQPLGAGPHHLIRGVALIKLGGAVSGGASLVVQGPAVFEIESEGLVRLTGGKLSARVPHTGRSFAVVTPDLKAVDLGTEFGLEVVPGSQTFLDVFDGRVRAEVTNEEGGMSTRILSAREAVVARAGEKTVRNADPQPLAFVRPAEIETLSLGYTTPLERWVGFSRSLRQDPDLVGYYPFDNKNQSPDRLVNRAAVTAGRHDAVFARGDSDGTVAPVWSSGRWPGKDALAFGSTGVSSVNFTNVSDLIPDKAISVCVWLKRSETARPVHFLHGTVGRSGQFNLELMGTDSKPSPKLDARNAYFTWADKDVASGEVLPAGSDWYFLCVTSGTGGTTDFYLDGKKVSSKRNGGAAPLAIEKLALGAPVNGSDADYRDFFRGSVDELMLFKRVLSEAEIQRLYTTGGAF